MNIFLNAAGLKDGCISDAVSLGDFVYVSGQYGEGNSIEEQTMVACHKLSQALSEFGLDLRHVVKFTVYLSDLTKKDKFLSIYKNFIEAPYPAMTVVQVNALEEDAMVSIDAFAINTLRYEKTAQQESCSHNCDTCDGC
ncbi:RidA family protein [Catenisphaera adipataccumulans]|jgi:2-iminobutanoate/2-iminopropanoate deaminase|uniref:2-iminobutanoate/2-iminopropanoate deaminase n=1 Tax=Catenisphaera adipataccumulans TaxID=700500 RepID=A0A7W8D0R4_9FIRM|nr:RidA family protein [Catenisphaera adipataccumulans]MBB5183887.1 2-iminobutanoate/2-iminopropanoate deaminase [Catenisphaera adipataccumulans]